MAHLYDTRYSEKTQPGIYFPQSLSGAQKIRLFVSSAPFQREILRRNKVFSRRHTTSISREKYGNTT